MRLWDTAISIGQCDVPYICSAPALLNNTIYFLFCSFVEFLTSNIRLSSPIGNPILFDPFTYRVPAEDAPFSSSLVVSSAEDAPLSFSLVVSSAEDATLAPSSRVSDWLTITPFQSFTLLAVFLLVHNTPSNYFIHFFLLANSS